MSLEASANNITQTDCNKCGGKRNHWLRAQYLKEDGDDETNWSTTMQILECCGCETLSFRKIDWFSEWDEFYENDAGEERRNPGTVMHTYPSAPAAQVRKVPSWIEKLEDSVLTTVLREVYGNLDAGHHISAAAGARILIDRAMNVQVGDIGGFEAKLKAMAAKGLISLTEKQSLQIVTDAGSAAAHRGYSPSLEHLHMIMDTIENLLHRLFVLPEDAAAVQSATPIRQRVKTP